MFVNKKALVSFIMDINNENCTSTRTIQDIYALLAFALFLSVLQPTQNIQTNRKKNVPAVPHVYINNEYH